MSETLKSLPREDLIGWIGKQVSGGVRVGGDDVCDYQGLRDRLAEIFRLKKEIVSTSKSISDRWVSLCVSRDKAELVLDDSSLRIRQEEQFVAGISNATVYASISAKRQLIMETYFYERNLLKQRRASRVALEEKLRSTIATLGTNLCVARDVGRVASVVSEQTKTEQEEQLVMNERELEWKLMEDEVRLTEQIAHFHATAREQIDRLKNRVNKAGAVEAIESEFIEEKTNHVYNFKTEINMLRTALKSVENSVSKFRAYLRDDEKLRRTNAQILRC